MMEFVFEGLGMKCCFGIVIGLMGLRRRVIGGGEFFMSSVIRNIEVNVWSVYGEYIVK